jgi:hypothetical protein
MTTRYGPTRHRDAGHEQPVHRAVLLGIGAGLLASAATGLVDRLLDSLVAEEHRERERRVRAGSPHAVAGPRAARRMLGRDLSTAGERRARAAFAVAYGVLWGVLHALVRRKAPRASALLGLPFAVPFYLVCDGVIAPLLRLTPTPEKVPWPFNAKELANHVAWTATAELVHRRGGRAGA